MRFSIRTGCQWRMILKDFPSWSTVYWDFWRWHRDGTWEKVHRVLREKVRNSSGWKATPTTAIVDVRTAEGGEERGFDAGKKLQEENGILRLIRGLGSRDLGAWSGLARLRRSLFRHDEIIESVPTAESDLCGFVLRQE